MLTIPRDSKTVDQLQRLLQETCFARDKLYAVAETLSDPDQEKVCAWFADRLGGYAATFQQLIAAGGTQPAEPSGSQAAQEQVDEAQSQSGDDGVLREAKRTEEHLAKRYRETMHEVDDRDMTGLLAQHQRDLEVVDSVLRVLTRAD